MHFEINNSQKFPPCRMQGGNFSSSRTNKKFLVPQHKFLLCRSLYIVFHHVCHSCDELTIGRLAPAGGDGVAEVFIQGIQITPAPGHFDEMTDGSQKIAFIGIFMA